MGFTDVMGTPKAFSLRVVWETTADPDCEDHLLRIFEILLAESRGEIDEFPSPLQNEGVGTGDSRSPQ
jgi:hypothetical protein